MKLILFLCLIVTFSLLIEGYHWSDSNSERQLLSEVKALTFYQGKQTTGRRSPPLPQLVCVAGDACGRYNPMVVLCTQVGNEQWRCESDLPSAYKFGPVEVNCEGYEYPEDPYILKGSCALDYSLYSTGQHSDYSRSSPSSSYSSYDDSSYSSSSSSLLSFAFFAIVAYIIWKMWSGGSLGGFARNPFTGFGGGFGGGPGFGGGYGGPGYGGGYGGPGCAPSMGNSGPGFFSGMAAGGLMGYLAGNRRGYAAPRTTLFPGSTSSYGPASSGFGSSGFGGGSTRTAFTAGGTRRR